MDALPLISSKLVPPRLPEPYLPRPDLAARLNAPARLVLISSQAGSGKSSLIAEWAAQAAAQRKISWLQLDRGDDHPLLFMRYLIAALRKQLPTIGEPCLAALHAIPPALLEGALSSLINEIAQIPGPWSLVIDDYHLINDPAIHQALTFLLDHLPEHFNLVLGTRADPPLPIARLRAGAGLLELRAADLRFGPQESAWLLQNLSNSALREDQQQALHSRIEGWITGIKLAALSLKAAPDPRAFVNAFTGSHRFIIDYLTEEIFNQQAPNIQQFLLNTSILERLSAPLCQALCEAELEAGVGAQSILETLERANLFVVALDDSRTWFRYHRLFADLLQRRLEIQHPQRPAQLHQRAADWFDNAGLPQEAIQHALASADQDLAAALVGKYALPLLEAGHLGTLLGWLQQLPTEKLEADAWLCTCMSWCLVLSGQLQALNHFLALAARGEAEELHGHLASIRAYQAALGGDGPAALQLAQSALQRLPQDNRSLRAVVTFLSGGINVLLGRPQAAIESMGEAARLGELSGNLHVATAALCASGDLELQRGNQPAAQSAFLRALELGSGSEGQPLPIAASAIGGLAELDLQSGDFEGAVRRAERAVALAEVWGNNDSLVSALLTQSRALHACADQAAALQSLAQAERLAEEHQLTPNLYPLIEAARAQLTGQVVESTIQPHSELLSERELQVLKLLAAGASNQQIAEELVIALGTVKAHTSSIYSKLGVRGRTQAVLHAQELGLI